jgi:hypothetical protein
MSIEAHPEKKPLALSAPPHWGEIAPKGETALVVRFILSDRVVTYPFSEFKRWEHVTGSAELLTIAAGKELVVIEGRELAPVRAALDLGTLSELRLTYPRSCARPGPRVQRIAIEPS